MAERLTAGVTLAVDKTTIPGATFATLLEITSIDLPSESVPSLDTTVLADTARQFRPGLYDGGEVGIEFNFDPDNAEHIWLRGQVSARAMRAWRITIPADGVGTNAWKCDFVGFLTEFTPTSGGVDEFLTVSTTIKVSGTVTYTQVTP